MDWTDRELVEKFRRDLNMDDLVAKRIADRILDLAEDGLRARAIWHHHAELENDGYARCPICAELL